MGHAIGEGSESRRRQLQPGLAFALELAVAAGGALSGASAMAQAPAGGAPATAAPPSASTLPALTVSGERESIDEAPPALPGGQVGSGARMGILGNTPVIDTPFSVTSYTSQAIENEQARAVSDILANDPSVRLGSARSNINEDITIRGFNVPTGDFALNGLFGLSPYWRAPLETVERVEVIKGPSAALFGMTPSGSVGGVVNLVPKRATDAPITTITGTFSSDSVFGVQADIGRRFGEDNAWGVRVNVMDRQGDTPIKDQSTHEGLASLGLDYRGRDLRASLDLMYQKERIDNVVRQFQLSPTLGVVPSAPDNTYPYPGMGWSDGDNKSGLLKLEYDLTNYLTAYASYGERKLDWDAVAANPVILNTAGDYAFFGGWQRMTVDSKSSEAGLRSTFSTGAVAHTLALSFTQLDQTQKLGFYTGFPGGASNLYAGQVFPTPSIAGISNPLQPYLDTKLTSTALADTMSFMKDTLLVTLGVRRQQVQGQDFNFVTGAPTGPAYDESATTPFAGVVYKLRPDTSFYASYVEGLSRGDTAPISAAITNPGESLPPYKSKQKEVGAKFDLAGNMLATASLFEITKPNAGISGSTFGVFGEQRNRGVEVTLAGEVSRGVRLLGGVSYTDGVIARSETPALQGKKAIAVPDWQVNLGAEWDTPFAPGLTLTGRAIYTSDAYVDAMNTLSIPGWTRFDAGARYLMNVSGKPVTLRLNVENLFDKDYWGAATAGYLFVGSPRTISMSASIDL